MTLSRLFSVVLVVLALLAPVHAQRANLSSGWTPSVEYTNTPSDCTADVAVLAPCAPPGCVDTELRLRLSYRYRVTVRNLTADPVTTSGTWLTFFSLFNAPDAPTYDALLTHGCGVPEFFAVLAPNDGVPGGPDEITFDVVRTFTVADGVAPYVLPATAFAPNARVPGGPPVHRLYFRATHWWNLTVNGQPLPNGSHWPIAFDLEASEARLDALVSHL